MKIVVFTITLPSEPYYSGCGCSIPCKDYNNGKIKNCIDECKN